jgi:hypothetical protein
MDRDGLCDGVDGCDRSKKGDGGTSASELNRFTDGIVSILIDIKGDDGIGSRDDGVWGRGDQSRGADEGSRG